MGTVGYAFSESDRAEFNRIRHKLDTIRGPAVSNYRSSITIGGDAGGPLLIPGAKTFFPVAIFQTGGAQAQYISGTLYPASWRYDLYPASQFGLAMPTGKLAVSVPLCPPRIDNSGYYPAGGGTVCGMGIATINANITLVSPGTIPSTTAATPYRLLIAFETSYEGINCIPGPGGGSGSGS